MSFFNIDLIKKIKSIKCVQLPVTALGGIFKERAISLDGNIISWFNSELGQEGNKLHYLEFNNNTPDELNFGTYTVFMGTKTKIQSGSIALNFAFDFFSIDAPNNILHLQLENEMYKDIKLNYTESENPELFLNKIFTFDYINEAGVVTYSTKSGNELILLYEPTTKKWVLAYNDKENKVDGIETNDNTTNSLVDNGNAFNDFFQFIYYKKLFVNAQKNKRKKRK